MLLLVAAAAAVSGCAAERPEDPVVVTGNDVPRLAGSPPAKVIAYRYLNGQWQQVPVQVDERAMIDLGTVYNQAPNGVRVLSYTDPNTFAGPDPDAALDANDEIALMGIDGGAQAPVGSNPPNVVATSGEELRLHDSLGNPTDAYVYLYRQTGSLDPAAGRTYVDYQVQPALGQLQVHLQARRRAESRGLDRDNELLQPALLRSLGRRRAQDHCAGGDGRRHPRPPQGSIRARHLRAKRGHLRRRRGGVHRQQDGPVRAIRAYIGANSGPFTGRQHIFYQRREEITTYPARPRDSRGARLLRLQPRRVGDDLSQRRRAGRGDDRRHTRDARRLGRSGGRPSTALRAGSRSSIGSAPTFRTSTGLRTTSTSRTPSGRRRDSMHG